MKTTTRPAILAIALLLISGVCSATKTITIKTSELPYDTRHVPDFSESDLTSFSQLSWTDLFLDLGIDTLGISVHNMIDVARSFTENTLFPLKVRDEEFESALGKYGILRKGFAIFQPNYFVFSVGATRKALQRLQDQFRLNTEVVGKLEDKIRKCQGGQFAEQILLKSEGIDHVSGILVVYCEDTKNVQLLWSIVKLSLANGVKINTPAIQSVIAQSGVAKIIPCNYNPASPKFKFPLYEKKDE